MHIVERGCAEIDHNIRLLLCQFIHWAHAIQRIFHKVPYIFTDGYGEPLAFKCEYVPFKSWFEITVFIKYIVVG